MAHTDFTTTDCAAHVAQFNHAQPVAPRALTLDERIDQLKVELLAAKASDNQAEIERLWIVWEELSAEIEAEQVVSADCAADACLPFEPTQAEMQTVSRVQPTRETLRTKGFRPRMRTRIVPLDLDALIAAVESARDTRPSRRVESAYEWLIDLSSVEFDADGCLIVNSATWSQSTYRVNKHGCSCPAHKPCWHMEALTLVHEALENAAIDAAFERDSFLDGYVADQASLGHFVTSSDRQVVQAISRRAAQTSGVSDLWA